MKPWCLVGILLAVGCHRESSEREAPPAAVSVEPPAPKRAALSPLAKEVAIPWLPPEVARHRPVVEEAARQHGVDAELVAIVTLVESGGWVAAKSGSGARGLMQLMPSTAAIVAEERGLVKPSMETLVEPATNLDLGAYYLGQQLRAFAVDDPDEAVRRAAGAYNGGPTHFRRFLEGAVKLSHQTVRYRRWVGGMWEERHAARSPTFDAWRDAGGDRLLARAKKEVESGSR